MEWLDNHNVRTPETHVFNDFERGRTFLKNQISPFIFKPSGELLSDTTYVKSVPGNEDLLFHLDKLEKISKGAKFILQRKFEWIEVSSEVWYYKGEETCPFCQQGGSIVNPCFIWPKCCYIQRH